MEQNWLLQDGTGSVSLSLSLSTTAAYGLRPLKVTLLLFQEPKHAGREKDNNQEFEKRVPESQDMQKLEIFTEFFHLYSVFLVS